MSAARELAARDGAKLMAAHVVSLPSWAYVSGGLPANWGELLEADRRAAEERIATQEGVETTAVYGVAVEELAAFGDRVDLLVVGSRNYGPVRRLVLGSTSGGLARHARCALLVLPRTAAAHPDGGDAIEAHDGDTVAQLSRGPPACAPNCVAHGPDAPVRS